MPMSMIPIEAIRLLAEKGLSAADILEIAEALCQPQPRSAAAEKQKRYRDHGGGKIPEQLRQDVFDRDDWTCLDCGAEDNLCCDHVIPVSKGGETSFENLQTLCIPCNSRKKDRIRKRDTRRVRGMSVEMSVETTEPPPFPSPSPFLPPHPQQTPTHTHTPVNIPRARKGRRLSDDWEPVALAGKALAMVDGWPAGAVDRELAKFRNYWIAKSGSAAIKSDWQRTWVNWLLSADERIGRHERNNTHRPSNDEIRDPMVRAILKRQAERAAGSPDDFGADAGDWREVS